MNIPEATALIADALIEAARDGARLEDAVAAARSAISADQVMPGVVEALGVVRVEAVFDDGTRLAVINEPIGPPDPSRIPLIPGAEVAAHDSGGVQDVVRVRVRNCSAVPISVTSHWHFFECNPRLSFDRAAAYGRHLRIPAGQAVRFDPDVLVEVELVPFAGNRVAVGFAGLVDGRLDDPETRRRALERVDQFGYLNHEEGP